MNVKHTRRFEMLVRVRDFGRANGHRLSHVSAAEKAFAALNAALDAVSATDVLKVSAAASGRADRKRAARKALVALLGRCIRLSRLLRAQGLDVPLLARPAARSDQALLAAGRHFALNAEALTGHFTGHGLGPSSILRITETFDAAIRGRSNCLADYTGAQARTQDLLRSAHLEVRSLDVIVAMAFGGDPLTQEEWKRARREEPHRDRRRGHRPPSLKLRRTGPMLISAGSGSV